MFSKYLKILVIIILFCFKNEVSAKEITCTYSGGLSFTVTMKSESDINFSNDIASDFKDLFKNTYINNSDCPTLYYGVVPTPDPLASPTYVLKNDTSSGGSKLSVSKNITENTTPSSPVVDNKPDSNAIKSRAICGYGTSSGHLHVEYIIDYDFSDNSYVFNVSYKKIGYLIEPKMSEEKTFVESFVSGNNLKCVDNIYAYNSGGTWTIYASKQTLSSEYIISKSSEKIEDAPKNEISCNSKFGIYYIADGNKRFVSNLNLNGASSNIVDNTTIKDFKNKKGEIVCPEKFYYVQNHGPSATEYLVYGPTTKPNGIMFDNDGFSTKMYSQDAVDELIDKYGSGEYEEGSYKTGCGIIGNELADKLKWFLDIVKYGGVLLAISLGMLDFAKAVFADEADANKKAGQKFIKRIIAAALIFIVPLILQMLLNIVEIDGVDQDSPFCIRLDS